MKAHLAKVSLALLSTVFLLGCQDMGSGPVGLDGLGPEFHHGKGGHAGGGGGGKVTGTFTAVVRGNVTAEGIILNEGQTQLTTGGTPATLDLTFFQGEGLGWDTCFQSGEFTGPFGINFKKKNPVDAEIQFNFDAQGIDGTVVRSGLALHGVIENKGNWPAVDGPSTIAVTTYVMIHGNGPGSDVACTGNGNVSVTIEVTRTS